jgi:hypothetical protein
LLHLAISCGAVKSAKRLLKHDTQLPEKVDSSSHAARTWLKDLEDTVENNAIICLCARYDNSAKDMSVSKQSIFANTTLKDIE